MVEAGTLEVMAANEFRFFDKKHDAKVVLGGGRARTLACESKTKTFNEGTDFPIFAGYVECSAPGIFATTEQENLGDGLAVKVSQGRDTLELTHTLSNCGSRPQPPAIDPIFPSR